MQSDNGQPPVPARALIIATGVEHRQPDLENVSLFDGAGVSYGATAMEAQLCLGEDVIVVGGGNSDGPAAVFLTETAKRAYMLVRGGRIVDTMSRYLIRRIEDNPVIILRAHTDPRTCRRCGVNNRVPGRRRFAHVNQPVDVKPRRSPPRYRSHGPERRCCAMFVVFGRLW